MKSAAPIPWRSSLVTRFALLWALLLGGLVLLCGWLIWRGGRESLIQTWQENLRHDGAAVELKMQSAVTAVMRDAAYLAKTPTLREFVRAQGSPEESQWRKLVQEGFHALLEGKPSYFQVRLIGVANEGRELIRLDHSGGNIETISEDRLQKKGDRDYFQETLKMPAEKVYVSAINLNQEFGKVTEPYIPTLRAAVQVPGPDGRVFGVVVINVDVTTLLEEIQQLPGKAVRLMLAGENGDFLIHPDKSKTFGSDLGRPWRFSGTVTGATESEGDADLEHLSAFAMAPGLAQQTRALLTVPANEWLTLLKQARDRAAMATGIAAAGGIVMIVLLSRWLGGRLHRVTSAMSAYEAGQDAGAVGVHGEDELGRLETTFRDMAAKVRDHVTRLDAARREAEEATQLKEEFLAVMSHEIRTPMNSVTGLIRVLERNQPAKHQEPVIRSLRTAARNLMALLNDALDYTKLNAGGLDFESQVFSLRQHLDDLILTHRPVAMQKGLSLELEMDPELPALVRGDPVRLMQILNNLVSNALKFTDTGSVLVSAVSEPGGGRIAFAVEDTGVGIPETEQVRIFAPFQQVRRPDGRQFDGSGLGLSIARELVERQGGSLTVRSSPGQGTCFTVTLPLPAEGADSPGIPGGPIPAAPDLSGLRILYVEDVLSNCEVMAAILEETGAVLDCANTGTAGLEKVRNEAWDVVLLDLQLPDATGIDLARRILESHPALPVIAVTAQAGSAVRVECEAAGMVAVVLKPVEPDQLFSAIRQSTAANFEVPSLEALESIFGNRPDKYRAVLASLGEEFSAHAEALSGAVRERDATALRALRHRMHTALVQLRLSRLGADLDALAASLENPPPGLVQRCLAGIADAARHLSTAAQAAV